MAVHQGDETPTRDEWTTPHLKVAGVGATQDSTPGQFDGVTGSSPSTTPAGS